MASFSAASQQPCFVMYGFAPQDSAEAVSRNYRRKHSLLSKQLHSSATVDEPCSPTASSSCGSGMVATSIDSDSDSLCCDKDEAVFYSDEIMQEFPCALNRPLQSAPIPISPSFKRSIAYQRQLLQQLLFKAEVADMLRAAEQYRMASDKAVCVDSLPK